ncbi:MAG: AbrB/MazE/SpoVT family DNA-binding domain-containing protein [Haloferacaceae archaeon]
METRKLQQVGGGTYTVSIPKEWAVEHRLEAGAEVHLYAHGDGSIVVRSAAKDGGRLEATRVELDGGDPALAARVVRAAHAAGYGTVTLVGSFTDADRRAVRSLTRSLVGATVPTATADEITVRSVLDASDVAVRQWVVQLRFVALSVHRQAASAFVGGEQGASDRLRARAEEAARLRETVARHASRSLVSFAEVDRLDATRPELFDYDAVARRLAGVADRGVRVARAGERLSSPLPGGVADDVDAVAERADRLVTDAVDAVLDGAGVGEVRSVLDDCERARADLDDLERTLFETVEGSMADGRALTRALDGLDRTVAAADDVAAVALRAALRDDGR